MLKAGLLKVKPLQKPWAWHGMAVEVTLAQMGSVFSRWYSCVLGLLVLRIFLLFFYKSLQGWPFFALNISGLFYPYSRILSIGYPIRDKLLHMRS